MTWKKIYSVDSKCGIYMWLYSKIKWGPKCIIRLNCSGSLLFKILITRGWHTNVETPRDTTYILSYLGRLTYFTDKQTFFIYHSTVTGLSAVT